MPRDGQDLGIILATNPNNIKIQKTEAQGAGNAEVSSRF
jgi:hypothetical protein